MSKFELIEFQFDPDDFELSLEDDFLINKLSKDIEAANDVEVLKAAALKLLTLAVHRQAIIRGLVRRVAKVESSAISKFYED